MSKHSFRVYRFLPMIGMKLHIWAMDDYGNDVIVDQFTINHFISQEA